MARTNSKGSTSARTGNLPFTGTMAPPLLSTSRQENPAIEAWATQEQPLSSYTFSHTPHQPFQLQRSMSQRKPDLELVPELEDPAAYLSRNGLTPSFSLTPSPISIPTTPTRNRLSSINTQQAYNIPTPETPTSDMQSLTTATTLASNMSRNNSLYNDESLHESIQMMKVDSNTSFSNFNHCDKSYDQVTPHYQSSRHHRRSSEEEQSQLLVGAGGASHDSQFSHSFPTAEAVAQFHSSGSYGEKMEKSQSNESTSSTSSSSSRSKQRLQAQNALAAARPILLPKGGSDDNAMSRANSSQSMARLESKDGAQDKIAISKPTYQRPKHDRVYCKQCDDHPDGFRGEHELRRHQDRQHKLMVKKWVCINPSNAHELKPVVPLSRCKACYQQKKKYGAYYNAAAHLRRAHFRPKAKGRSKSGGKVDDAQKRGGKAGGNWPTMEDLKPWMKEVEEIATEFPLSTAQQDEADASDDENYDDILEEPTSTQPIGNISGGSFDNPFIMTDATFNVYPSPTNDLFGMQNMQYLDISQQNIDSSMNCSQNSFDTFTPFQNDHLAFDHSSISIPQTFDDPLMGLDPVNFSFQ